MLLGCASDFLRLHYRDLNLCANLSFEVLEAESEFWVLEKGEFKVES